MIRLLTDTADQAAYLTLSEGRSLLAASFTHYLLCMSPEDNSSDKWEFFQVMSIELDCDRYTKALINTEGMTTATFYRYAIFGQNSASNLDPNHSSVVGKVEIGRMNLQSSNDYFSNGNTTANKDITGF